MAGDSEFSQYLSELDNPNTEGYTFFTKSQTDGYSLEIHRKFDEVFGTFNIILFSATLKLFRGCL